MCKELIDSKKQFEDRIETSSHENTVKFGRDIHTILDQKDTVQYELDCAMWYGCINTNPSNSNSSSSSSSNSSSLQANPENIEVCKRLFILLCHGGLLLRNKQSQWQTWSSCGIPICSAVSHGGAILVQIPIEIADKFVTWFKGNANWSVRTGTHGIIYESDGEKLTLDHMKYLTETRVSSGGEHRGINLGLGGVGKFNPFSGNTIEENGDHGHLYCYFDKSVGDNGKWAGMLIKCEDSEFLSRGQGGHMHWLGDSGEYSCTGGKKWASHSAGPGYGEDNMFILLDATFLQNLNNYPYGDTMIGSGGVIKRSRTAQVPLPKARIFTVKQWQAAAAQATKAADLKEKVMHLVFSIYFDGVEDLIAAYHKNPSDSTAKAIVNWCAKWSGENPNDAVGRGLIEELQRRATNPAPTAATPIPATTAPVSPTQTSTTQTTSIKSPPPRPAKPPGATTTPTTTVPMTTPSTTTIQTMTAPATHTPATPAPTTTTPVTSTSTTTPPGTPTPTTPAQTTTTLTFPPNPFNEDDDDQKPPKQ